MSPAHLGGTASGSRQATFHQGTDFTHISPTLNLGSQQCHHLPHGLHGCGAGIFDGPRDQLCDGSFVKGCRQELFNESNLKGLDYVSPDSAYLLQPQKDGTYEPVIHNINPGQLVTALERGFLPLARAVFEAALETKEQERMNSGERDEQSESHVSPKGKPRPFKCEQCGTRLTTSRKLNSHIDKKHGGS